MILGLLNAAMACGAMLRESCKVLGIDPSAVQRWRGRPGGADRRAGPKVAPKNKLSDAERSEIIEIATSPEFRDLPPSQIVPRLADRGRYVASESTFYRELHGADLLHHRECSRAPMKRHRPRELRATGPNQVWSWDITYLRGPTRGAYFYLYLCVDVWSRKIVGWVIELSESAEHSSTFLAATCEREGVKPGKLVIHSDNGGPMKGATLLATLIALGVETSFSRPSVSNDNPFSEALYRTLKSRPEFPKDAFETIAAARAWTETFVRWYNEEHHHSAIRFVTPMERHDGLEKAILAARDVVYARAKKRHPSRWSMSTRNWEPIAEVVLNPAPANEAERAA